MNPHLLLIGQVPPTLMKTSSSAAESAHTFPYPGRCSTGSDDRSTNQHPNAHDYSQLLTIYTTTIVGAAAGAQAHPPARNDVELDGPRQWGKLIKSLPRGRTETEIYEADFGGGRKVFTFVVWADGADRGRDEFPGLRPPLVIWHNEQGSR